MGNMLSSFGVDYEDLDDKSRMEARQNLKLNIITAKDGDTKDIIGPGGPTYMPIESARVGGYCEIDTAYYDAADCSGTASYTTKQIGFYGIC